MRTQPLLKLWRILPLSIKKGFYPALLWGIFAALFEIVFALFLSKLATQALQFNDNDIIDKSAIIDDSWKLLSFVLATSISLIYIKKSYITSTKLLSIKIASFASNTIYSNLINSGLTKILSTDNARIVVLLTKNIDALVDALLIYLKSILSALIAGLLALLALVINPVITIVLYLSFGLIAYVSRYFTRDATSEFRSLYESSLVDQVAIIEMLLKIPREILLRSDNQFFETLYREKDNRLRKVVGEYSAGVSIQSSIVEIGGASVIFMIPVLFLLLASSSSNIQNISIPLVCIVKSIPYFNQFIQKNSFMRAYRNILDQIVQPLSEIISNQATLLENNTNINCISGPCATKDWKVIQFSNIEVCLGKNKKICYPTFTLRRNTKLAIVGGIGKGKTTLLDLIAGFIYPTKGAVLIDGIQIDPQQYSNEIKTKCSYLAQKSFVINGSLKYNVILGNPYSKSKYDRAVSKARLDKIPLTDPDAIIGPTGRNLSGGQEKKVSLARSLYEAKDILILDEPSSAFDRTTAIELMETINSLENTTIIMVTHDEELIPKGFQTLYLR